MKEFISRIQAQKILGCDKDTIMKLLRSGEIITSRKENGGWLVLYDSLEEYIQRNAGQVTNITELQKKEIVIIDLDLPPRVLGALDIAGVHSIDQLRRMTAHDLLCLKGIDKKAVATIESQLALYGIELRRY